MLDDDYFLVIPSILKTSFLWSVRLRQALDGITSYQRHSGFEERIKAQRVAIFALTTGGG